MCLYRYTIDVHVIQDPQNHHRSIELICKVRAPHDHPIVLKWYRSEMCDTNNDETLHTTSHSDEEEYTVVATWPINDYNIGDMYEYRCQIEFMTPRGPSTGYCQLPPVIPYLNSVDCGSALDGERFPPQVDRENFTTPLFMCCARNPNTMVSKQ